MCIVIPLKEICCPIALNAVLSIFLFKSFVYCVFVTKLLISGVSPFGPCGPIGPVSPFGPCKPNSFQSVQDGGIPRIVG